MKSPAARSEGGGQERIGTGPVDASMFARFAEQLGSALALCSLARLNPTLFEYAHAKAVEMEHSGTEESTTSTPPSLQN